MSELATMVNSKLLLALKENVLNHARFGPCRWITDPQHYGYKGSMHDVAVMPTYGQPREHLTAPPSR